MARVRRPANRVIAAAFAISGVLAAVGSVLLVAQTGIVNLDDGLPPVLFGFIATGRRPGQPPGAVLGGFLLGFVTVGLQTYLPRACALPRRLRVRRRDPDAARAAAGPDRRQEHRGAGLRRWNA